MNNLEQSYINISKSKLEQTLITSKGSTLPEGTLIFKFYLDKISLSIKENLSKDIRGLKKDDVLSRNWLMLFSHEKLATIVLTTILDELKDDLITTIMLCNRIRKNLVLELRASTVNTTYPCLDRYLEDVYGKRSKLFRKKLKSQILRRKYDNEEELSEITLKATSLLINIIQANTDLIILKNVRSHLNKTISYVYYTEQVQGLIHQCRNSLFNMFKVYPVNEEHISWKSFYGGFNAKELKVPIIRTYGKPKKELMALFDKNENRLKQIAKPLNYLGETEWQFNTKIIDVIKYIIDKKIVDYTRSLSFIGGLPYMDMVSVDDIIKKEHYGETDENGMFKDTKNFVKYLKDYEDKVNEININVSNCISLNLVLKEYENYKHLDKFHFTYQYDFRGRIYPAQNHINTQGNDLMKSVMMFKEGSPIEDKEDEFWFYVYGANQYGYDKDAYDTRISKIKEVDYISYAKDPIVNKGWTKADNPLLFLAWCFEALSYEENPKDFLSYLPIGLDASCSGIQIYSGLLKDREGAEAVNVVGTERQDIYQRVADRVNEYLAKGDYNKTITYVTQKGEVTEDVTHIGKNLKVDRSLTKRNTMTQPYSVTKFGMYEQLKDEIKSQERNGKVFPDDGWKVAKFLVELNDRAIQEIVKGARVGQEFLKDVTKDIIKGGEYIYYNTPFTNFPVIQRIFTKKRNRIYTQLGYLTLQTYTNDIDNRKMVSGIAPNVIHSLDAVLLAMVVIELREVYDVKSFHFIHDQYGVPINKVKILTKVAREKFYELFSNDPLQYIVTQMYKGNSPRNISDVLLNTLDIKDVLDSKYLFS